MLLLRVEMQDAFSDSAFGMGYNLLFIFLYQSVITYWDNSTFSISRTLSSLLILVV